ncbi:MAG: peptidoglycan-binding domain-containing protein [Janthinobacterium lividum]
MTSEFFPAGPVSQTGISQERAIQIQAALGRYGYLTGSPTGIWDTASVAAMRRLQSDHHWQIKFMPDARALIFLGLGPGKETP